MGWGDCIHPSLVYTYIIIFGILELIEIAFLGWELKNDFKKKIKRYSYFFIVIPSQILHLVYIARTNIIGKPSGRTNKSGSIVENIVTSTGFQIKLTNMSNTNMSVPVSVLK